MHHTNSRLVDQRFNWLNLRWLYKTSFYIIYILPVIAINIIICLGDYKFECNGAQVK